MLRRFIRNEKEVNTTMKEGIHPNYEQTTIKCACTGGRVSRFNKKFGLDKK